MRAAFLVVVVLLITIRFQTELKLPEGILLDNTYDQSIAPTNVSIEVKLTNSPFYEDIIHARKLFDSTHVFYCFILFCCNLCNIIPPSFW